LQNEDLFDAGLSVARRRADHQQPPQHPSLHAAMNTAFDTRSISPMAGIKRSGGL
jgi:hypothetical protein